MARYTDIDLYLTKNELTNDINYKYDVQAITQSIKNIVSTTKGERMFNPSFGGNLLKLEFNDLYPIEVEMFRNELFAVLNALEPRAVIGDINIINTKIGYWTITITYSPVFDPSLIRDLTVTIGSDK